MKKLFGFPRNIIHFLIISVVFIALFSCGKKDLNPPEVTLKGNANIYLVLNGSYIEEGATATDPEEGEVYVNIEGEVNTALEGIYEITYTAYDEAGNSGRATRWVHVYNESAPVCGNFEAVSVSNSDTITFNAVLSTSTTVNKRFWIQGYAMDSTAVIYADITDNQISIQKQEYSSGGNTHFYSGTGTANITDSVLITINFTDSTSGIVIHGVSQYVK